MKSSLSTFLGFSSPSWLPILISEVKPGSSHVAHQISPGSCGEIDGVITTIVIYLQL